MGRSKTAAPGPYPPNHKLAAIREARGLSQDRLGEMVNMGQSAIARIESGHRRFTVDVITKLAKALEIDPAELLPDEPAAARGEPSSAPTVQRQEQGHTIQRSEIYRGMSKTTPVNRDTIPVFGRAYGGDDDWFELNGSEIDRIERPSFLASVPDAYAVIVSGTSMEPRYYEGETIYVHPSRPQPINSFVVITIRGAHEGERPRALVKRLIKRGGQTYTFEQFNPARTFEVPIDRVVDMHLVLVGGKL